MNFEQWNGFNTGVWTEGINVRDFIDKNYTPYEGDGSFLSGPTERTKKALAELERLKKLEQERGGVLSIDTTTVSSLCNYKPGYLVDEDIIVGLQTDEPLKRGVNSSAVSVWLVQPVKPTATSFPIPLRNISNTEQLTMTAFSVFIPMK